VYVIKLSGGLGNQMFQYAFAIGLKLKTGCPVMYDGSFFGESNNPKRHLELGIFDLRPECIKVKPLSTRIPFKSRNVVKRFAFLLLKELEVFKEHELLYNKEVYSLQPPCLIIGHWMTEKYFKEYDQTIRELFAFKKNVSDLSSKLSDEISRNPNTVSVHVRRGDYVATKENLATFGSCDLEYYKKCFQYFQLELTDPIFYVFSDDIEWCRCHLLPLGRRVHFVDHNHGAGSWEDMFLMSKCEHHIIANSTFSWWAAWLNNRTAKIVLAPKKWFATNHPAWTDADIVPESWIKI